MATNDEDVSTPEDEEDDESQEDESGEGKDTKDDKGTQEREPETPEARKSRLERELKRHQAKHPDLYKEQKDDKPADKVADGKEPKLDYGQKAYLTANDIKSKDEQALALRIVTETGRELEDVIDGPYFKSELKALRDENAAKDAIPGTRRSRAATPSSVEYWLEKGGLPPDSADNRELRTKIVNARMQKAKSSSQFTDRSVVGNA